VTGLPAILLICVVSLLAVSGLSAGAQRREPAPDLAATLARVSSRVEAWYFRAQNVVATEHVTIQPLRADLAPAGFPRRLAFELRVQWDPSRSGPGDKPVANVVREPLRLPGTVNDRNDPGCTDPKPVSPEPLAMLLRANLHESTFAVAGTGRVDGRAAIMLDYRGVGSLAPDIRWTEECVSVSVPGRSRGRIWVDAASYDVVRMDDRLAGEFEFDVPASQVRRGASRTMVVERAESSTRYRRVVFDDPVEELLLPASIDTLTVVRGGGTQRLRIAQRFSAYRRFLTGGRVVD
jgi:hypothetical protein